jgi:hypothetical protein
MSLIRVKKAVTYGSVKNYTFQLVVGDPKDGTTKFFT